MKLKAKVGFIVLLALMLVISSFYGGMLYGKTQAVQENVIPRVPGAPRAYLHEDIERELYNDVLTRLDNYPGTAMIEGYIQWDSYLLFIVVGRPGAVPIPGVYEYLIYVYTWNGEKFEYVEWWRWMTNHSFGSGGGGL